MPGSLEQTNASAPNLVLENESLWKEIRKLQRTVRSRDDSAEEIEVVFNFNGLATVSRSQQYFFRKTVGLKNIIVSMDAGTTITTLVFYRGDVAFYSITMDPNASLYIAYPGSPVLLDVEGLRVGITAAGTNAKNLVVQVRGLSR